MVYSPIVSKTPIIRSSPSRTAKEDCTAATDGIPPEGHAPSNDAVRARIALLARRHPDRVRVQSIGQTQQGRSIDQVLITDPRQSPDSKQHILIAAGQHGNEESARLVALKLMDFLLSANGRPTLARQLVAILPNVSPDAAAADSYVTPAGIKPNLDHGPDGPVSPEARALQSVAESLMPEAFVDIHARGHAGCSHDMVLFPPARPYTEDEHLLHCIARDMADEGERSGIPHVVHPLTWPGWGGPDLDGPSSTLWMYRQYKSLVFLTENAEHNTVSYPQRMRAASGVGRLKALLSVGNQRDPHLYYPGYPCQCAVGMFHGGVVAIGSSAAKRRASRVALWRHRENFQTFAPVLPEVFQGKTLQVSYTGPTLATGAGFQVRVAGRWHVREVRINGRRLAGQEADGFVTWHDRHTTYAIAALPELVRGDYEIVFRFQ